MPIELPIELPIVLPIELPMALPIALPIVLPLVVSGFVLPRQLKPQSSEKVEVLWHAVAPHSIP